MDLKKLHVDSVCNIMMGLKNAELGNTKTQQRIHKKRRLIYVTSMIDQENLAASTPGLSEHKYNFMRDRANEVGVYFSEMSGVEFISLQIARLSSSKDLATTIGSAITPDLAKQALLECLIKNLGSKLHMQLWSFLNPGNASRNSFTPASSNQGTIKPGGGFDHSVNILWERTDDSGHLFRE